MYVLEFQVLTFCLNCCKDLILRRDVGLSEDNEDTKTICIRSYILTNLNKLGNFLEDRFCILFLLFSGLIIRVAVIKNLAYRFWQKIE